MTAEEKMIIQGIELKMSQLLLAVRERDADNERQKLLKEMPEWVTLEQALAYKGGAAKATLYSQAWLQPCCGANSRFVGGRKCWRRNDVLEWLDVTDDTLWQYAQKQKAAVPDKYRGYKRGKHGA